MIMVDTVDFFLFSKWSLFFSLFISFTQEKLLWSLQLVYTGIALVSRESLWGTQTNSFFWGDKTSYVAHNICKNHSEIDSGMRKDMNGENTKNTRYTLEKYGRRFPSCLCVGTLNLGNLGYVFLLFLRLLPNSKLGFRMYKSLPVKNKYLTSGTRKICTLGKQGQIEEEKLLQY